VKAPEVKRREMTPEVKAACGSDYDAIVILAAKTPPPGGNDAPTTIPHPTVTHDQPSSQYVHHHPVPLE
jgi:hypothetical protein